MTQFRSFTKETPAPEQLLLVLFTDEMDAADAHDAVRPSLREALGDNWLNTIEWGHAGLYRLSEQPFGYKLVTDSHKDVSAYDALRIATTGAWCYVADLFAELPPRHNKGLVVDGGITPDNDQFSWNHLGTLEFHQ